MPSEALELQADTASSQSDVRSPRSATQATGASEWMPVPQAVPASKRMLVLQAVRASRQMLTWTPVRGWQPERRLGPRPVQGSTALRKLTEALV